ncbi:MAG: lipoyl(octanoyl) transferase LipB [Parcubacteria group bacterium]|nr:lipoyl(octanoyl) transferase LipB [Parcubacteria group bacterium]MBI3075264.1 lipoyl(octanoyl) transferase LipB [Parcubacteria group bacterium]
MTPALACHFNIPCSFEEALANQECLAREKRGDGVLWNHIILAEHPSVYTYEPQKGAPESFVRNDDISSLGAPLVPVHRGGSMTFHGPGQLVCYFIFHLKETGIGAFELNSIIERVFAKFLAQEHKIFSVPKPDHLPPEASGLWVESADGILRKIVSRGLLVGGDGITRFGCALNLSTDLSRFAAIYPCGLDIEMTSVLKETGKKADTLDTAYLLTELFGKSMEAFIGQKERRSS